MTETISPTDQSPKVAGKSWKDKLPWALLLVLPVWAWALGPFPEAIRRGPDVYIFHFSWWSLIKMGLWFYGLYILPGLALFYLYGRNSIPNPFFSSRRILLAFCWGILAHTLAIFFQKILGGGYSPPLVLGPLALSYLLLAPFSKIWMPLLKEGPQPGDYPWLSWIILGLGGILAMEMTLRGRASSVSLMGDGYPHLITLVATLIGGPLPDANPFYSTFILNVHPMSFHALWANLITLLPGSEMIDPLRYFSTLMIPLVLVGLFAFFSVLTESRTIAAIGSLAVLFVSGGGLSLRVPVVFFPWYWAMAWVLTAGILFILIKDGLRSFGICFTAGLVFGASVLIHPMMAPRLGALLCFFFPLEFFRRLLAGDSLKELFVAAAGIFLGTAITLGLWLGPLLFRYPWEETYTFAEITTQFRALTPRAYEYVRALHEQNFRVRDLYYWTRDNGGIFPLLGGSLGLLIALWRFKDPRSPWLLAWVLAMGSAIIGGFLFNPYRYFEYFFLGSLSLAVFGLGWIFLKLSPQWRPLFLTALLFLAAWSVRVDYWPKYRLALHFYGRTDWPENALDSSRRLARLYKNSREKGALDDDFGATYRGYLWSRQKKVWDIHVRKLKEQQEKTPQEDGKEPNAPLN